MDKSAKNLHDSFGQSDYDGLFPGNIKRNSSYSQILPSRSITGDYSLPETIFFSMKLLCHHTLIQLSGHCMCAFLKYLSYFDTNNADLVYFLYYSKNHRDTVSLRVIYLDSFLFSQTNTILICKIVSSLLHKKYYFLDLQNDASCSFSDKLQFHYSHWILLVCL